MGAQKKEERDPNYDPEADDAESPVHEVHLRGFRIGRFPVTVQEFGEFMKKGGYTARKHWVKGFGKFSEPEDWQMQEAVSEPAGDRGQLVRGGGVLRLGRRAIAHGSGMGTGGERSEVQQVSVGQ